MAQMISLSKRALIMAVKVISITKSPFEEIFRHLRLRWFANLFCPESIFWLSSDIPMDLLPLIFDSFSIR
ncbi:hypothetical protein AB669_04180 [Pedobacter sp. BMA]|nr:hypothetical protein AB669_04180 [Pedobacter sp. BMA]